MKKIIYNIFITIYAIIAIFTTVCLLSYNEHKISEFGNYSFVIVKDNTLHPEFNQGELVIVNQKGQLKTGEKAFFYNTYKKDIEVALGQITQEENITESEKTYTIEGDKKISSEYVLGPANGSLKVPVVGAVLDILESKWGFLFLIVLPCLIAFIYEITVVISEIKNANKTKGKENEKKDK